MAPPDYIYWSATKIAAEIRSGNLTSSEVVGACLDRIEQVNPNINAAVVVVADRARREAWELDRMAKNGDFKGPLHGVPVSIKDSLDTEGIVTTGGTLGRRDFVPAKDAPVVARLRSAGAVLMAKTNSPELTLSGETNNLIYGRTNNPFDFDKSAGGSSGGAAAMIAVGGAALELGSDTGGSIREPAHLCGITGIKPTSGRTPRTGHIIPYGGGVLDSLTQIGPMARYVEDLALTLPIICGPDGNDPSVVPVPIGHYKDVDLSGLKIAWYTDNGVTPLDGEIKCVVEQTVSKLAQDGLQVEARRLSGMKQLIALVTRLRQAANGPYIRSLLKRYGTNTPGPDLKLYFENFNLDSSGTIELGLLQSIDEAKSRALRFMSGYDAIICPPSHKLARAHGESYKDNFESWSYITIHNLLGWPGAVVRAGTGADGILPIGVQVVAAPWREDIALAIAARIETLMGGYQKPEI